MSSTSAPGEAARIENATDGGKGEENDIIRFEYYVLWRGIIKYLERFPRRRVEYTDATVY